MWPLSGTTSTTAGFPNVSVPVLSIAIALSLPGASTYTPPLIRTPFRAAAARAATMLTGVEMTSAHGQAMTRRTSAR